MQCQLSEMVRSNVIFFVANTHESTIDISEETLDAVTKELQSHGYDCYQTSLGGVGASASILSNVQDEAWIESADRHTLEKLIAHP